MGLGCRVRTGVAWGTNGERDSCLVGEQLVHRVAHSALLRGVLDGEESDELTIIRVGKRRPSVGVR